MVRRCTVLAHRLALEGGSVLSQASIEALTRTLTILGELGIEEVCVVDGEQADALAAALEAEDLGVRIVVLANRSWRHATGSALLLAREFIEASDEPCLILRGDRDFDRDNLVALCSAQLGPYDAVLAVSPKSDCAAPRCSEVRVRLRQVGRPGVTSEISQVGLDLEHFDSWSIGHAVIRPELLTELEELPNPTLEDGLAQLVVAGGWVRALQLRWPGSELDDGADREVESGVETLLEAKPHPRYTLLNPGPVNTTARVKSAMVHHDVCHRDGNFSELMVSLTGKLRRIFRGGPRHSVCLITGSGTAAMECAISSTVPRDGKVLVVDNGAFGERLLEICELHEMDTVHLRYPWGDEVRPRDVEDAFEKHPDIDVVVMIHHETSVGLLNPVGEVGAICRRNGALFIVDAVSSLGAEDLDVVRDNIDICYASANKCLHSISGAGFMCVAPRVWAKIEHIKPRSYYLDLKRYRHYIDEKAQTPFTPAVSTYFALDAACSEFLADGHAERTAMYRRRNQIVRQGLVELGMVPFTRTGRESNSVVTVSVPDGINFQELYDGLKARGYIIYGCKDVLAERFFQVANMGDLEEERLHQFLDAAAEVIAELRSRALPARASRASFRS